MRVTCKCGSKGFIRDSKPQTLDFIKLYCQCPDVYCGHTWVAHVTFSHTLSPSVQTFERMLFDRLREMPEAKQRELFEQFGAQAVA